MIPLEVRFLGWRFAVLRSVLLIAASVGQGLVVDLLMTGNRPAADPGPGVDVENPRP